MRIDVVSDVVCPWCLIGIRRLEQALAAMPGLDAEVIFHPFQLDPSTPPEGVDLRERLQRKYGVPAERMFARVEAAARESGIPLDFSKVTRGVNTLGAHTLLRHALPRGTQRALKQALLDAYFLEGRDVGNVGELVSLASSHEFSPDEARLLLTDEAELDATRDEAAGVAAQGIDGVPFFIFERRWAVSGAQPVETLKTVIERATAAEIAPPTA